MIDLFNEKQIRDLFHINDQNLLSEMNKYGKILDFNPDDFSKDLAEKYKINVPILNLSNVKTETRMEERPGFFFRPSIVVDRNKTYEVAVANYSIPYTGDGRCFAFIPTNYGERSLPAEIDNQTLKFKVYTEYANLQLSDEVKKRVIEEAQEIVGWIQMTLYQLKFDCDTYNNTLQQKIKNELDRRRKEQKDNDDLNDELNPFK